MIFTTLKDAVFRIEDGSLLTFSGMELNRAPMALIYELVRQGKKNLRTISIPNPLATDVLIKSGCVKHATFGFNGFSFEDGFVIAPNWRKAIEDGAIEWKETDLLEIIQSLKAGSLGLSETEVPSFENTDYLKANHYKKKRIKNREVILTGSANPDFALIHAQYADRKGNVLIQDPLIDKLISAASRRIIVSVEKVVDRLSEITIPSEKIECIVEIENGALPTSCFGFYNYDLEAIREYLGNNNKKPQKENKPKHIDLMIVYLASLIGNGSLFATGVASPIPMIAAMFAKKSGKKFDYFNCGSGAINPTIKKPSYSSVTINALEQKESFIELPEIWDHALKGKADLMCFSSVQISKNGDVNMTCIGNYKKPKIKLPGPAGAVTLRNLCKKTVILVQRHTRRTFVEKVDFITTSSKRSTLVVTNLGVLKLGEKAEILSVFPHSSISEIKNNTSFELEETNAKILNEIDEKDLRLLDKIDPEGIRYRLT